MKKILIIALIVFGAFIFKIPEYRELNTIAIIEGIAIDYEYKYYKEKSSSIEKAYKEIVSNTKKKLYLKRCKFLISNLYTTDKVLTYFDIKPTTIYHSRDNIYDKLKVTH